MANSAKRARTELSPSLAAAGLDILTAYMASEPGWAKGETKLTICCRTAYLPAIQHLKLRDLVHKQLSDIGHTSYRNEDTRESVSILVAEWRQKKERLYALLEGVIQRLRNAPARENRAGTLDLAFEAIMTLKEP